MTKRKKLLSLSVFLTIVFIFNIYFTIPKSVTLQEGEVYDFPPLVQASKDTQGIQLKLFGFLPLKTVQVNTVEKTELIPCGNTVGIRISVDGVMVVGFSDFRLADGKKICPAKIGGLKEGDIIKSVNGVRVSNISGFSGEINSLNGKSAKLEVVRANAVHLLSVTPEFSKEDNAYRIGAWVRDSTSGIGTITFINPKNNTFGALGHGITDVDTGKIIPADGGDVILSRIVGVKKGLKGSPGELKGIFSLSKTIGNVLENRETGVYGKISGIEYPKKPIPTAMRSQIKTGHATILSGIENERVEEYAIEIQKIMKNSVNNKGMIIKITDEKLLKKTGGIVQGMSGSPILQNGLLVGAVTHVFINDPTRGYATFIDLMLNDTIID
ncbi:MAG: SpoIVB peptidase precursor [Firmicutes bacterium ADurb.Bin193]|nr:MAG: SpoIVB peptidase precursor [Firmicutes bacterium ADurb.Bin193]